MRDTYNGWTNRATWLINVWFNPESVVDVDYAESVINEQYDEMENGPLKDMLDIDAINWDELRSHFEEDTE